MLECKKSDTLLVKECMRQKIDKSQGEESAWDNYSTGIPGIAITEYMEGQTEESEYLRHLPERNVENRKHIKDVPR